MLVAVQRWLNHDYLPFLRPYLQWTQRSLTWLILAAMATLLFGVTVQPKVIWLSASIMCVILLGICWPWMAMRGVACRMSFSRPRTTEGEPIAVTLTLTNRWPWPLCGFAVVGGFHSATANDNDDDRQHVETALAVMPAWSDSVYQWDFTPSRRGLYPKTATYIATGFPFGLRQSQRLVAVDQQLIAWPRRHAISESLPDAGVDLNGFGLADARPGDAGDILGVRPYRNGDPLRRVHWPQTARHSRLIVCERQAVTRPSVRIIADLRGDSLREYGGRDGLERIIRTTASLCESLHQRRVRIEYCDAEITIRLTPDRHGLEQLLDHLAMIPEGGLSNTLPMAEMFAGSMTQSSGMLEIVVMADELPTNQPHYLSARVPLRRIIMASSAASVQDQWEAICRDA